MRELALTECDPVAGGFWVDDEAGSSPVDWSVVPMLDTIVQLPKVTITGTPVSSGAIKGSVSVEWGPYSFRYDYDTGTELAVRTVQLGVTLMALPLGPAGAGIAGFLAAQGMKAMMSPGG